MPDEDALERRLQAVERTLADGDHDLDALREAGEVHERLERLESSLATLRERVDDLDAATQALRGYVGNVRSVNRDVERRADAALAAVDRLETNGEAPPSSAEPTPETADGRNDVSVSADRSTHDGSAARRARTDPRSSSALDARSTGCPYCSTRSTSDSEETSDELGRSAAPGAVHRRESTAESESTDGPRVTSHQTPPEGTPASPRRENPTGTPPTTRTDRERDEGGTLDRIRALLA